ncbi:MAG: hypothetical protein M5U31_00940 [Acidimicrobiia bacterium]|nr:hypothetical protein [Acidimicrobiia bacterium]
MTAAQTKTSFCRFCHTFCGMKVDVVGNQVVAARGDPDNPVSQGYTCLKGRAEPERINHPRSTARLEKAHGLEAG